MAVQGGPVGPAGPSGRRAASPFATDELTRQALHRVVDVAWLTVPGAERAGVTITDPEGVLHSAACSDDLVARVDQAQSETGQGPCLEASRIPTVLLIEDMAAEKRWPAFAERAARLGIGSMISCGVGHRPRGALNLHTSTPGAFGLESIEVAEQLAAFVTAALAQAWTVESLKAAMASRQTIGEATGILMERHRLTSHDAVARLISASQRSNVKLRDLAEQVVRTGQEPATMVGTDPLIGRRPRS